MDILKVIAALLLPLLLSAPPASSAAELVVLVDTATEMPMARFERHQLVAGIHFDIGLALARKMGRTPRFISLPRKRIVAALEAGTADILCSYVPEWLNGSFQWSQPFIPIVELLLTDHSVPRPGKLEEVAGRTIGTVLGYAYPEVEEVLGKDFVRDDGSTAEANLRKLAVGRVKYAVTIQTTLDYRRKLGTPELHLHPPMVLKTYQGQCAVSRKGKVGVLEVNHAIAAMQTDGSVAAIVAKYQ